MKFLANENFPLASIQYLRGKGFDVKSIGIDHPSITDNEVMEIAINEERTILTFDRDYGELIFKSGFRPPRGVVYLRFEVYAPDEPGQIIETLMQLPDLILDQSLTVLDRNGIRQRRY